jgi:hypothetical protein
MVKEQENDAAQSPDAAVMSRWDLGPALTHVALRGLPNPVYVRADSIETVEWMQDDRRLVVTMSSGQSVTLTGQEAVAAYRRLTRGALSIADDEAFEVPDDPTRERPFKHSPPAGAPTRLSSPAVAGPPPGLAPVRRVG